MSAEAQTRSIVESDRLWERATRVIPAGTQTLSKAPSQFVDGVSPKFLARGHGSHVWDVDGNEYVDWPMALGPILLGYDHPAVTERVIEQIHQGTTFTLMHPLEVELSERLVDVIPCARRVRFAKNGADATNGAIRAARALTKREHVIATGYHGYHDWYIASTELNAGIPAANRGLIHGVPFADLDALEAKLSELDVAAVIMEMPAADPPEGYLQAALDTTHEHGAYLILDEIVTGFRYALGGAQERFGFEPDLACYGKGMANGYPLAAVVGTTEAMEAFETIFFSMTYSGETVSLAAAVATLDVLQSEPVIEHIWQIGEQLRGGLTALVREASFEVGLIGNASRSAFEFGVVEERALFLQETHKRGVLFGVPIFPTYAHTEHDVEQTVSAVEVAFELIERARESGDYERFLEGRPPGAVFQRKH
ncbi:MAG: aminotransferase class III-fold pyridoxal phosphate-dependent enzyme [Thermoleophilaceae bacterium]